MVLKAHEPYPAIAVDKGWNMVLANAAIAPLLKGVEEPALLSPPVNVLRLSLHPKGLAPFIANFDEWRTHLIERLRIQIDATADPAYPPPVFIADRTEPMIPSPFIAALAATIALCPAAGQAADFTARSASILRSSAMSAFFRPRISCE